jgi:hypothetical protein
MPGWVWASSKATAAWIDTRKVWALTAHAHLCVRPSVMHKHTELRARRTTDWRIYGFLQNRKTASVDFRKSVKA